MTQWRMSEAGPVGLDYGAIEPTARMCGIEISPEVFGDIRTMESEVLKVMAERMRNQRLKH